MVVVIFNAARNLPGAEGGSMRLFAAASEAQRQYGGIAIRIRFIWERQKIPKDSSFLR